MKKVITLAALMLMAACQTTTTATETTRQMTDKDRLIAAIEGAGCQIDPSNRDAVLDGLGMSEDKLRRLGSELVAEGKADVSTFGVFKLTTGKCL